MTTSPLLDVGCPGRQTVLFLSALSDLHSNVAPEHGAVFLYSALGLAAVEITGFVLGVQIWFRGRNSG